MTFRTWQVMQQTISAAEVKELRLALRFTQENFARFLNVSTSAVRQWEAGRREPTGLYLERLLGLQADQQRYRDLKQA